MEDYGGDGGETRTGQDEDSNDRSEPHYYCTALTGTA